MCWLHILLLTLALGATPAVAQPAPEAPILALRAALDAAAALDWPPPPEVLDRAIAAAFDLPAIAAAVLGRTEASAEQRVRLQAVLGRRMSRGFTRQRPDPAAERLTVLERRPISPGEWLVLTRTEAPGQLLVLAFRVQQAAGALRIIDVLRDGVSAVQVQRQDLATALRTRGLAALLPDLEAMAER